VRNSQSPEQKLNALLWAGTFPILVPVKNKPTKKENENCRNQDRRTTGAEYQGAATAAIPYLESPLSFGAAQSLKRAVRKA
jgi:hypothetical protein